jgi:uncharacterized protein YdhG (YjbR/CyaY superfamily)
MESVAEDRRPALDEVRKLCRKILNGYEERIEYGMPAYRKNQKMEVAFASQKRYISLYCLKKKVVDDHCGQFAALSVGKGCIRFRKIGEKDLEVIASLLRATTQSPEAPC